MAIVPHERLSLAVCTPIGSSSPQYNEPFGMPLTFAAAVDRAPELRTARQLQNGSPRMNGRNPAGSKDVTKALRQGAAPISNIMFIYS